MPGQNWEAEIDKAFSAANVVLIFLSKNSVVKRGFVQREANEALSNLRYKLPTDIYIIPILLEECEVPDMIGRRLQYLDVSRSDMWDRLDASLKLAAEEQQIVSDEGAPHGPYRVFEEKFEEVWDGSPGHSITVSFPRFASDSHAGSAKELTDYFRGRAAQVLVTKRQHPWDQFDLGTAADPEYKKIDRNGQWESYSIGFVSEHIVSVSYMIGWYGARAAHPNSYFETRNFAIVDDRVYQLALSDLFEDLPRALERISGYCASQIEREYWSRTGEAPDEHDKDWISKGLSPEEANFAAFVLDPTGITFHFSTYQVAAYAFGSFSVTVPLYDVLPFIKQGGPVELLRK